ncbi:hypothetical protein BKH43_01730 [Helicobacter sp. 13S00401-1]|uniref:hypothetical protein n=1 Tax=Helicobacter sp. 13S00401-1 TaxID=1905758 RepID=UPI000BA6A6A6|nr:hypothetical protein [Helicobacter sp. 13S00401-1]PAF51386.1 hypothetical protein BKH43_01730 [Helicobacter sp. 13S00401-1]
MKANLQRGSKKGKIVTSVVLGIMIGAGFVHAAEDTRYTNPKADERVNAVSNLAAPVSEFTENHDVIEAIRQSKFTGFAAVRQVSVGGNDALGNRWQTMIKVDATSARLYGFQAQVGIYMSQGTTAPDSTFSDGDVQGSRAIRMDGKGVSDAFNFSNINFGYYYDAGPLKSELVLGRMNMRSALVNQSTDYGLGGMYKGNLSGLDFSIAYYDSWVTDNIYKSLLTRNWEAAQKQNVAQFGIGNNLIRVSVANSGSFVKGLSFEATYLKAVHLVDIGYLDGRYKIGFMGDKASFDVYGQVGYLYLNDGAQFQVGGATGNVVNANKELLSGPIANQTQSVAWAKNAGLYNIQANLNFDFLEKQNAGGTLGFMGSFGEGYGVSLANGTFKTAGSYWQSYTTYLEGTHFTGAGSKKGSNIHVAYAKFHYAPIKQVTFGLDLAYIHGKTNMPLLIKAQERRGISNDRKTYRYSSIDTDNAGLFEINPRVVFKYKKGIAFTAEYSQILGDMQMWRAYFEARFTL